ncbi:MAG: hypothetical protein BWY68_00856 [bacterium ADurb.Bin400]|nr:MAG: hypothetical protein BWY68_00856 [bacterium ADurb.Bin400]
MLFATLSISSSWYFAHNVAVLLWLLFIYEFLTNSRRWTLGLLAGLLLATRTPAGLGAIFLITVNQITLANSNEERIKRAFRAIVATPIPVIVLLLLLYNFLRFGNPLEFGYSGGFQTLSDFLAKARDYGTFSLAHLPGNLYYALLSTPLPVFRDDISHVLAPPYLKANPWGISIFITSPYLFYLFTISYKDRISKIFLATTSLIALLVFTYYGIGFLQFGYRYALDFFPLLFVLLVKNYHQRHLNLSSTFKTVIIISAILNLIWILYLYNVDSVVNYINQNNCF